MTNAGKTGPRAQHGRRERGDARSTRWPALERAIHDAEEAFDAAETRAAILEICAEGHAQEQASFNFEARAHGERVGSGETPHGEAAKDEA